MTAELVAEGEDTPVHEQVAQLPGLRTRLVPEVQDVDGENQINGREGVRTVQIALDNSQPTVGQALRSAAGGRTHLWRRVQPDKSRRREGPQELVEAFPGTRPKLDDPPRLVDVVDQPPYRPSVTEGPASRR